MSTDGGGWTLIARVNKDFDWVCPSKKGGNCYDAKESSRRADLFDSSHWSKSLGIDAQSGVNSGISTDPKRILEDLLGDGSFDVRFSFYGSENSTTPRDDAYATFHNGKKSGLFSASGAKLLKSSKAYTWKVLKQGSKGQEFGGNVICWVPDDKRKSLRHTYEGGLFMGHTADYGRHGCHLSNSRNSIQVKSHLAAGNGWYKSQPAMLHHARLQVESYKIAIWVRSFSKQGACPAGDAFPVLQRKCSSTQAKTSRSLCRLV
jgi:hypothetical protein